jgi:PAS domain S-box-containing protein
MPKHSWISSLRSRLILLTLVLLVPAFAAAGIAVYGGYLNNRQGVEKHLQETSRALSLVVDRQFGQAEALLWALSTSALLHERNYAAFDAWARTAIRVPGTWVVVEDDKGQVINTLLPPGSMLPGTRSRDHWKGAAVGTVRISNLFKGLVAKEPAVGADTLVVAADGSQLYVSIIMLAETVSRVLADQSLPQNWIGAIIDRSGTVVARNRDASRFVGQLATPDNVARVRGHVTQGVWEGVSLDGVPTVLALSRSPGSGWSTIVAVPQSEITAPARRSALYLTGAGALLLSGGAAVAWRLGRSIAVPVAGLADLAQNMGQGGPVTAQASGLTEVDRVADALASASTQLRMREASLRASEERLRATHENAPVSIAEVDGDGRFLSVNEARCRMTGHSREELIGQHFAHVTAASSLNEDMALFSRQVAGELDTYTTDSQFIHKDGRSGWARVTSTALRATNGTFLYAIRVVEDITERRAADRRQKLLIDELNHRVKNTLAVVQSLAWQAARQDLPPKVAHERFQERLLALSRTHNLLNESFWEGASLRTILEAELAPYLAPSAMVQISGPEVQLLPKTAIYGALSATAGRVQVDWSVQKRGDQTSLIVNWRELQGPTIELPPKPGFGSRLLRQTINLELDGKLDLRFEPEGVWCTMTIATEPAHQLTA